MSVVVIGAGVSELLAALYLKRAGHEVVVVDEAAAAAGARLGASAISEWIPPAVVRDLELERHGLVVRRAEPAHVPLSGRDAGRWPLFCARMQALAGFLETLYDRPPPDPLARELGGLRELASQALRARRLGREGLEDLLRLLPMSAADFLDEWFESGALKAQLGAVSVINLPAGPRSGGTAFNLLHHHVGNAPGVFAPIRSNAAEVLRRLLTAELRQGRVQSLEVRDGAVSTVVLDGGEAIAASAVLSGAHPRHTLTELLDPGWLDPELVRAIRSIRARGVAAHARLTLDGPAGFSTLTVAPSLDSIERAYDDWKYGQVSSAPVMFATAHEAGGTHGVDVHVQFVPHDGAGDDVVASVRDRVLAALSKRLGAAVTDAHVELVTPAVELALDQVLWMRPVPQLARYATPIRGLYLCGAAMHPGTPAAGANAAKVAIEDLRAPRR